MLPVDEIWLRLKIAPMAKSSSRARQGRTKLRIKPGRLVLLAGLLIAAVVAFFALRPAATPIAPLQVASRETFETLDNWQFKVGSGPNYKFTLQNNEMQAEVNGTALHNWLPDSLADGAVEVDARWVDGTDAINGRFGLILGRNDKDALHFEYFPLQRGQWSLIQATNGEFKVIGRGTAAVANNRPSGEKVTLKVVIRGREITLFANGNQLQSYTLGEPARGQVGVSVSADTGKTARVAFDNFTQSR